VDDDTRDSPTLAGTGRTVGSRYVVRRQLGRGATKEVYLAYDERLDREVALAFVLAARRDGHVRARLEREARITGRLGDHPNVITVYDTTELDDVPCLVLKPMLGGSLADALRRGPLDTAQALTIGRDVAAALAHAHAHGVVHRDVKPGNVWLTGDGGAALGDFGVARAPGGERLTAEGALIGTPRYLSPEQLRGAEAGPATDLYALGVTLRDMGAASPALDQLIAELTQPDPLQRPQSAASVAERLRTISPEAPARQLVAVLAVRPQATDPEELDAELARLAEQVGGSRCGHGVVALFPIDEAARAVAAAQGLRAGLEAGEVYNGTGTVVGTALELAELAQPGELVLGERIRPSLEPRKDTPFLGREPELEALELAFVQAAAERVCHLTTVIGVAGIGKSRLVTQFAAALEGRATVLTGRCPAFGEGTTYHAFADMVEAETNDPALLGILGLSLEPISVDETALALRKLFETIAHERPLVLVVEDAHWAEPPLLDAIDHIVALSSGSPILVLCLARPELLEARPDWTAPQRNRSTLVLEALTPAHAIELARRLGVGEAAARIAHRAEGNPLFVEQLVTVADDTELPVSIQAVLAARIDRLTTQERRMLRRASVEGRTFHAEGLGTRELVGLVRKGLIEPDGGAFRFTHALIQEAAYAGLATPERRRAHADVAEWLEQRDAADAVVAYHLEQAGIADRAVERLSAAAHEALARGDAAGAVGFCERAVTLDDAPHLLVALGGALFEAGRLTAAATVLDEAIARAPGPRLRARAEVEREFVRLQSGPLAAPSDEVGARALATLGDDVRAWSLRAQVAWIAGRVKRADAYWERALVHADRRQRLAVLGWRAVAAVLGPTPVREAIARCEGFRGEIGAWAINPLATLHAIKGDFELAERYVREAAELLSEHNNLNAHVNHLAAHVYLLKGEPDRAEGLLQVGEIESSDLLATTSAMLAQALFAQDRLDEAERACETARINSAADDIVTQVIWRGVLAKLRHDEALAREAVALVEPTDLLLHHGDALLDLAATLDGDEAVRAQGLELHQRKRGD